MAPSIPAQFAVLLLCTTIALSPSYAEPADYALLGVSHVAATKFDVGLPFDLDKVIIPQVCRSVDLEPKRGSKEFCENPPVVSNLSLEDYGRGSWYSQFLAGRAKSTPGTCARVDHKTQTNPSTGAVEILANTCAIRDGPGETCFRERIYPEDGSLMVEFRDLPPGPNNPTKYTVAAVFGPADFGYGLAAVYTCRVTESGVDDGFFIISRSAVIPSNSLMVIKKQLECNGYDMDDVDFIRAVQGCGCEYK